MSELADEHDLGSCAARREGSSPSFPTKTEPRQRHPLRNRFESRIVSCPVRSDGRASTTYASLPRA